MDRPDNCNDCIYWILDEKHKSRDNRKRGECRKSEPSLGPNGYGYWPMTAYNEFCFAGIKKDKDGQPEVITG